jgi:hypothetical protein
MPDDASFTGAMKKARHRHKSTLIYIKCADELSHGKNIGVKQ